jgi:hypothetical protein
VDEVTFCRFLSEFFFFFLLLLIIFPPLLSTHLSDPAEIYQAAQYHTLSLQVWRFTSDPVIGRLWSKEIYPSSSS